MKRSIWLVPAIFAATAPAFAQRNLKDIPNPDPEEERKSFVVADGFEVTLYAADPLLAKPLEMNWDAKGRLWVACSETYPQILPGQKANDKVVVLEDTKGAGRADKVTVFADGLLIPTGIEPGDGGCYVANSTELVHFRDTTGAGKADVRRVVLSGFGTEDTHHILHTLRWGPDGQLYFNQSVYIHSHIETPYGVRRLGAGGIWQFRPETMRLEVFLRGMWNTWGHHFDRWGQSFCTDGAGGEGIHYGLPGATFDAVPNTVRRMKGLNPGSPKYCGAEILSGRHLPEDWRGNILTNDFRAHRVCRFVITEDGAGYAAKQLGDLIKTSHVGFRPIDIKMGPDGAIYIADWYNPIIQHGEVDFRDPRRDHTHGRIWRVAAKGRPALEKPKLDGEPAAALLEALKSPEDWTRHFAKRVMKERGAKEIVPALAGWLKALDAKDPEYEHNRLEGLWTYQSLDVVEPDLLRAVLKSPEPRSRAAAVRVLLHWMDRMPDAVALLTAAVTDEFARVRLEAVRALGEVQSPKAVEIAMKALDFPVDKNLDYALWLTARELSPLWLPAVQSGELTFGGNTAHLTFAMQSVGSSAAVAPLLALFKAGKIPADRQEGVLNLIASMGGPNELGVILGIASDPAAPAARRAELLNTLTDAARQRKVKPAGDLSAVGKLLGEGDEALRCAAARAAGVWKVEALRGALADLAKSASASPTVRAAAIEGTASLGGPGAKALLGSLCGADSPADVRTAAFAALTGVDIKEAAKRAPEIIAAAGDTDQRSRIFNAFLQLKAGPAELAAGLKGAKLPADAAKIGLRLAKAAGRDEPALVAALTQAGGLTTGAKTLTPEQMNKMVALVKEHGDPARGEAIFRLKEQSCLKCHAIAGAGGRVGPDLASIGASAQVDYLIDSLLLPDKAIKEGFHSTLVSTTDGRVFTGIKVRETEAGLVLRDAEDREVTIPKGDIDRQKPTGSLMPAGLTDTLTDAEFADLVRFLSELGKVGGPYAVGKERLVRTWQVLDDTADAKREMQHIDLGVLPDTGKLAWSSAYSKVSGALPTAAVPRIWGAAENGKALGFARFRLDVTTAGKIKLKVGAPAGLRMFLDKVAIEAKEEMILEPAAGVRVVTLIIPEPDKRAEPLRVELDDVAGSPARVQIVVGK